MKKLILLLIILSAAIVTHAQKRQGLGLHFGAYDFYGPQTGDYFLSEQYKYSYNEKKDVYDTSTRNTLFWKPMVKLSYWWEMTRWFDFTTSLSLSQLEYPKNNPDTGYINKYYYNSGGDREDKFHGELDARFHFNFLQRDSYFISPYVLAGASLSYHDNIYWGASIPVGVGANLKISKDLFLNLESAYKVAITNNDQHHLQHSIGFVYWFKPGYKEPEDPLDIPPPPDMDKDGVVDSIDACPTIIGSADMKGCPDSDNDGVADNEDDCPLVAGDMGMQGCPDTDKDGLADNKDQCPYVTGSADRNGCPVPDKDNDGFTDDQDRCPDQYSKTNNGCPEIQKEVLAIVEKAAKSVFFETGKATLKKASYASLNQIVSVLQKDPMLYVDIEGHTDNVGDEEYNMKLSRERAEACRSYLISKGIADTRITAKGYGETAPIADNNTATGKAQNRRTEFRLRNYKL
jgi:OmpA-OmpF porin, OOP family